MSLGFDMFVVLISPAAYGQDVYRRPAVGGNRNHISLPMIEHEFAYGWQQQKLAYGCCRECHNMLVSCLHTTPSEETRNVDIQSLKLFARRCTLCNALLSILNGRNGVLLQIAEAYNDRPAQDISYGENRMPDHEVGVTKSLLELERSASNNLRIELSAYLKYVHSSTGDVGNATVRFGCLTLRFVFHIPKILSQGGDRASQTRIVVQETLNIFAYSGTFSWDQSLLRSLMISF